MQYIDGHQDYLSSYSNQIMKPSFGDDYSDFAEKLGRTRRDIKRSVTSSGRQMPKQHHMNQDYVSTERFDDSEYLYKNHIPPYYQELEKRRERFYNGNPNATTPLSGYDPLNEEYQGFRGSKNDDGLLEDRIMYKKLNDISNQLNYMWILLIIIVIACAIIIALMGIEFIYTLFKGKTIV